MVSVSGSGSVSRMVSNVQRARWRTRGTGSLHTCSETEIQKLPLQKEKTAIDTWAKFDIDGKMITIDANIPYDELDGFIQEMKIKLYSEGKQ